ncbi:unnamed protein product [Choristocarpus tenellus]
MSRSNIARANFKKYQELTNPLILILCLRPDGTCQTDTPKHSETQLFPSNKTASHDESGDDEEDHFGLGAIMAKMNGEHKPRTSETYGRGVSSDDSDGDEEEDDPFGLGAIIAKEKAQEVQEAKPGRGAESGIVVKALTGTKRDRDQCEVGASAAATAMAIFGGEEAGSGPKEAFVSSKRFLGARAGYVFKKGALGLGYYLDRHGGGGVRSAPSSGNRLLSSRGRGQDEKSEGKCEGGENNGSDDAGRAAKKAREPVDVKAAVKKLGAFLINPKKTAKAASLMADLMEAELRPDNAPMFFRALRPLAADPSGPATVTAGSSGARVFRLLLEHSDWLPREADRVSAVSWELLFGLREEMRTDDSFQFAKASKRLRQVIEALGGVDAGAAARAEEEAAAAAGDGEGGKSTVSETLSLERKKAVLEVMGEAFKSYHLAWACPSIEVTFKAAADRRLLFPEGELRDALDAFTDAIHKRKSNPGGLMSAPARRVRAVESTAHPLMNRNKASSVIR